jgi:hypothetical protein
MNLKVFNVNVKGHAVILYVSNIKMLGLYKHFKEDMSKT